MKLHDADISYESLELVEAEQVRPRRYPSFILNLSQREDLLPLTPQQIIHGNWIRRQQEVLLVGPSHLVDGRGAWSCEAQTFKGQFVDQVNTAGFRLSFPGDSAQLTRIGDEVFLEPPAVDWYNRFKCVEASIFLGTPLEPDNWGRWIATVIPKVHYFKSAPDSRLFFCRVAHPWQKNFLKSLGVDEQVMVHDPGQSYYCRDVLSMEQSVANMSVSEKETEIFQRVGISCIEMVGKSPYERIFISRKHHSFRHPNYRVLTNEGELASALEAIGFICVNPESYTIEQQVSIFAAAKSIVCVGGAALYNTSFCRAGTKVITLESSQHFVRPHSELLGSLGHEYGIVFGLQDHLDPTPVHKRWSIDVNSVLDKVLEFC